MKNRKLLAVIMAIVLLATQFSMLSVLTVGAETTGYTALTGRDDFTFGVNIHPSISYEAYDETYSTILDVVSLGSDAFRINGNPENEGAYAYFESIADLANEYGLKMTLSTTAFYKRLITETENEDGTTTTTYLTVDEIDLDSIKTYYTDLATRYNGKISSYQLGNEMCNVFFKSGAGGRIYSEEYYQDLTPVAVAIQAATDAIHAVDPEAEVIINFSWQHMGFIHGLKSIKLDSTTGLPATADTAEENIIIPAWDVIGIDWYSNGRNTDSINPEDNEPYDYTDIIDSISVYEEDIIVAETNLTPNGWADDSQTTSSYIEDAAWLAEFATYAYNNSKIKGFYVYELYDEPAYIGEDAEGNRTYNKEAFYGLIDENGNKKETYNVIQALYGGTDTARPEIPAAPQSALIGENIGYIYQGTLNGQMNTNFHQFFNVQNQATSVDLSEADFIEFDFYVEDADMFVATFNTAEVYLRFYIFDVNNRYRDTRHIDVKKVVKDGWNHIAIATGDLTSNFANFAYASGTAPDLTQINGFRFTVYETLGAATHNSAVSGMNLAIANVCGTKLTKKTQSTVGSVVAQFSGDTADSYRVGGNDGNATGLYTKSIQKFTNIDFATAEYLEFDVYIEDYEAYLENLTVTDANGNANRLAFFVSNSGVPINAKKKRFDITNQITHSGWNHIVINNTLTGSDFATNSTAPTYISATDMPCDYNCYAIGWVGGTGTQTISAVLPHGYDFIAMTNVIGTVKATPSDSAVGATVTTLTTETYTYEIGKQFNYLGAASRMTIGEATGLESEILTPVDFTDSENIEFDIFVENWGSFGTALSDNELSLRFRIGSNNTKTTANYAQFSTLHEKITQSGWNHISITKSEMFKSSIDWANVCWFQVYVEGTNKANAFADSALKVSTANVIGTIDLYAPTDVMAERIDIGATGVNAVKFDSTGFADVALESTIDISSARMIELDVYVEDNAISTLSFDLENEDGGYASYEFTGLVNGWNHLAVRVSDLEVDSFDASALATVALYGTAGAEIYVANFYAADYVDGDADRNGEVNVIDLVRSKKVSVAVTDKGNIIAMDLADNDYKVTATDLAALRTLLLGK